MTGRAKAPRPSRATACVFTLDASIPPATADEGDQVCRCGVAKRHPRHQLPATPEQAEHRRRAGDDP